jgi:leucyl/phenylalanyl-tRNA--protein transferase
MPAREVIFPHPDFATEDGIVALGGDLQVDTLVTAYTKGIFPWPIPGIPLPWFSPDPRAILTWSGLQPKITRSLKKVIRQDRFLVTFDQAFNDVIEQCAHIPRHGQDGDTWLTQPMINAYQEMHRRGYAHSIEAWNRGTGNLAGGLYGVAIEGTFSAESMFFNESNASKVALVALMQKLHQEGLDWIDIQQLTPHLESLGAEAIPRQDFLIRLSETQALNLRLFQAEPGSDRT